MPAVWQAFAAAFGGAYVAAIKPTFDAADWSTNFRSIPAAVGAAYKSTI